MRYKNIDRIPNKWRGLRTYRISGLYPLLMAALFVYRSISTMPHELYSYIELIKQQKTSLTCQIPKLDPYDPSILQYISKSGPILCKKIQPNFASVSDDGWLTLNASEVRASGYSNVECSFRCFYHKTGVNDNEEDYAPWESMAFDVPVKLKCEFVEVSCTGGAFKVSIYRYHFHHVIPKPAVTVTKSSLLEPILEPVDKLNVLVFGIDSISYSNAVRQLPTTLKFFQNQMKGYVFKGHSKIGDNTWINLIAILTGKLVQSTKEFKSELDDSTYDRFFDDWANYIWQNFSEAGYRTFFEQDRADINDFNYTPKKGFKYAPTDHYMRPFWTSLHWTPLHMRSSAFCYDVNSEHSIFLGSFTDFIVKYTRQNIAHWGFTFWNGLSHDFLNKISAADHDLKTFFKNIVPYLNNSMFILFSDHGNRYDSIRQSVVGRIEARMPFLGIYLPEWFKIKYPDIDHNLRTNTNKLTTQFDLYATMIDVLRGDFTSAHNQIFTPPQLSLMRPIPADRSCLPAKIPEEFCPCYQESPLPVNSSKVLEIALFFVNHLNNLLTPVSDRCSKLVLDSIKDAHVFLPGEKLLKDPQVDGDIDRNNAYDMSDKSVKVLVFGDIRGNFKSFVNKITNLNKKAGPFEAIICVGEFFGTDEQANAELLTGRISLSVPIYVMGPSSKMTAGLYSESELAPNITCLGRKGLMTMASGLTVAYVSGVEAMDGSSKTDDHTFADQSIKELLLSIVGGIAAFEGVDLLLTSQWPQDVWKYDRAVSQDKLSRIHKMNSSGLISKLAATLKPRYHFSGGGNVFYERVPYRNHQVLAESAKQVTRFIGLGDFNNEQKDKSMYAFNIAPMKFLKRAEVTLQPPDSNEFPYTEALREIEQRFKRSQTQNKSERNGQYFFDVNADMHTYDDQTRKRGRGREHEESTRGGPDTKRPPAGPCWFCLSSPDVEKHLVISVGESVYMALAKGALNEDNVLLLPVTHVQSIVVAEEDVRTEIDQFKEALTNCFKAQAKRPVFFERNYKTQHLQIQVFAVPETFTPEAIKEVFLNTADVYGVKLDEVSLGQRVFDVINEGAPYFFVEIPGTKSLFCRQMKNFPIQFGREAVANRQLLNLPDKIDWRQCELSKEEETKIVKNFQKQFEAFDFTEQ